MKSLFEQNGGTYSVVGDYRLPNLIAPNEPKYHIGIWGQRRLPIRKYHQKFSKQSEHGMVANTL